MLSYFSKFIYHPSLIQQQRLFLSSSSAGNKYKKDKHDLKIDASHQSGTKSQQERIEWQKKEQGFTSDIETRQERIPENEKKKDTKTNK